MKSLGNFDEMLEKVLDGLSTLGHVLVSGRFRFRFGDRKYSDADGSSTVKFRREYYFHLPYIFPAGSVALRCGNGGN
jgi:hypothetical protein